MVRKARRRQVIAAFTAAACLCVLGTSLTAQSPDKAQDLKKAHREVQQGEKAEAAGKLDEAMARYDRAEKDAPTNVDIVGHAAALRAKMVRSHVDAAENAAIRGDLRKATDELHTALKIEPGNTVLAEREAQMKSHERRGGLADGSDRRIQIAGTADT